MASEKKSSDTFASLYLGGVRGAKPKVPVQGGLFSAVPNHAKNVATAVERRVWTVRALIGEIRQELERRHLSVWVEGEISNCRPAASGHLYFTLTDGDAQLPVVLFRREALALGFTPKDGDAVEVRGRVSVYEPRGQLQLIAERVEVRGAGALELAFQRLKAKLKAEGLFDRPKQALPAFPRCLGVVSSRHGAVIRDIVQVGRRRHARLNILLYPAAMQGPGCPGQVAAGVRWFNAHPERVDVIILARGGGSTEDLAGFNDEGLARAIAASKLPVVSAIGHETDFTIADFVADLRAATPSAAAELVTAAQHTVEERVRALRERVIRAARYRMMQARQQMARLSAEAVLGRLRDAVGRREQRVDELRFRIEAATGRRIRMQAGRLAVLTERLGRQDPAHRLALARSRWQRASGVLARFLGPMVERRAEASLQARRALERVGALSLAARHARVERAVMRLEAMSPVAVLRRGYALVYGADGRLLRRADDVAAGERVRARLAEGELVARIEERLA